MRGLTRTQASSSLLLVFLTAFCCFAVKEEKADVVESMGASFSGQWGGKARVQCQLVTVCLEQWRRQLRLDKDGREIREQHT